MASVGIMFAWITSVYGLDSTAGVLAKIGSLYGQKSNWNHVLILHNNLSEITDDLEMQLIHRKLARISTIGIANIENLAITKYKQSYEKQISTGKQQSHIMFLKDPIYRLQILSAWTPQLKMFMEKMGTEGYLSNQQEWLLILPADMSLENNKQIMESIPIYIDSEVILVHYKEGRWVLTDIWKVGPNAEIQVSDLGHWTPGEGLAMYETLSKYSRRNNFKGYHINVATIKTMPYESLFIDKQQQNFRAGYVVDIWHILQNQLNFTYTATNTLFGSLQKDGVTWNGMVGMLQNGTHDAAVAPLSITQIRSITIDFTIPIQIVSTRLYLRRPSLEATWVLYSLPFDFYLWMCIPCGVIFIAICLWSLNIMSKRMGIEYNNISFLSALWAMFSSTVQQASILDPKPLSVKLMFTFGFWSSLILYTCYSAILVSILTTMKPSLKFTDFDDIQNYPDWNVGVRTNTALADALALSLDGTPMKKAWNDMVVKDPENNLVNSNGEALKKVLQGEFVFFANKEYIIYRLQEKLPIEEAMNIIDTGKDFLVRGIGFGLQRNSPYKNIFNSVLSKMTSSGQLNRLKHKWWPNINRDPVIPYPSPGFKEVFTVFLIFGIGLAASLFILCLENFKRTDDLQKSSANVEPFTKQWIN